MLFSIIDHLINFSLGESTRGNDSGALRFPGTEVFCPHINDAVGIDFEGDFDLGYSPGCGRQAMQLNLAKALVVVRHLALTLENVDADHVLVVEGGCKDLGLSARDRGVAIDDGFDDATLYFDTHGERRHVEEQNIGDVTLQNTCLDGGSNGDHLVGIDTIFRLSSKYFSDLLNHPRHACHASNEQNTIEVLWRDSGVFHALFAGSRNAVDEIADHRFQLVTAHLQLKVHGSVVVGCQKRKIDFRLVEG